MKYGIAVTLLAAVFAVQGAAAAWPERPIRLIVPFAPGGNVDLTARVITPGMGELLGRNFIIDNRAGAGGAVGSEIAATAPADGYTLLFSSTGSLTIAPVVSSKLRYDPVRDFAAISLVSNVPVIMLVPLTSPGKTVKEFVTYAKSRGELTMGSSGNFSTGRLAGELFQGITGTRFTHVPYKGGGPAMIDLIGGRIDVMFDQISSAIGHVKAGKVRALAVNAVNRSPEVPEVPTMKEAGVAGVEAGTFTAMLAPAKTPKAIVTRLNEDLNKILKTPAVQQNFVRYSAESIGTTPAASVAFIRDEIEKWRKVVKAANIKEE
ncbi:MAG: tripartite tricarboxylate transporter substrate binding protein [Burkholderiales bacterium]|jgi:tripartite-type tricarboxylate transporter receptor subunit TctC|nr:tripartite tricarboxylate transporter substrate binding protein [Burkholderiales bacterium]